MAEIHGVPGDVLVTGEAHHLVPSAAGGSKVLCVRDSDSHVQSIQPWGEKQYRPPGTDGPFEQATLDGRELVYSYTWAYEGQPSKTYVHVVAWRERK